MRSPRNGSSVPGSPLDNAFSPAYLARLRERDDSLTAAEAELAGPWKIEPVPGRPGAVAREPLFHLEEEPSAEEQVGRIRARRQLA